MEIEGGLLFIIIGSGFLAGFLAWAIAMTVLYVIAKCECSSSSASNVNNNNLDFQPLQQQQKPTNKKTKSQPTIVISTSPPSTTSSPMTTSNVGSVAPPSVGLPTVPTTTTEVGPGGQMIQVITHPVEIVDKIPPGAIAVN